MCGRYVASSPQAVLAEYFAADPVDAGLPEANYNVAPGAQVPAVVVRHGERRLETLRWGLVPSWAKDPKHGMSLINARGETVATSRAFRAAFAHRRCILPADGYYEWQVIADPGERKGERRAEGPAERKRERKMPKQPWHIRRADGAPLALAGIWERWHPKDADSAATSGQANPDTLETCAIITTSANELLTPVHHRMPVLLEPQDWEAWLDPSVDDATLLGGLLRPADGRLLDPYPVSTLVNNVRNRGPELIQPQMPVAR